MKKQLMRYKLIADQKVGRANKSEVLNEELLQIERHMEHVRIACQSAYKKLSQCLQTHAGGDHEKRLKKLHETSFSMSLAEASKILLSEMESNQTLGSSFQVCAETQGKMAEERAVYEEFIDNHVITPLQQLVETEIPGLFKQRERLRKMVLDRDGAVLNHHKAHKAQFTPGINLQQATAKVDASKEELDQATARMELCKDQIITEMYEFVAKEVGHGQRIYDFHAKQLDYHRRCVEILEKSEVELKSLQDHSVVRSCFGRSLQEHLNGTKREIALPLEACCLCILALGTKEEGIFRIGGGASKLKKFRALVDGGVIDLSDYEAQDDIHAVAGALKQYLRELPEPLLTHKLHDDWIAAASIQDHNKKLESLWTLIDQLPQENRVNFRYLMKFCAVIAEQQEVNKMSPHNLSLVIAPNLLWSHIDDISKRMMESNLISSVIESVITYHDYFFKGDIDFAVTPNATTYHLHKQDGAHVDPPKASGASLQVNHHHPAPAPSTHKSPSHSRSPSTDLALEAGFIVPGQTATTPSGKARKHKGKAPPPPTEPPKAERRRTPPPQQTPNSLMPSSSVVGASSKPPVAAKRVSMRRPQAPPPQPPEDGAEDEGHVPQNGGGTFPKAKPRPPARKRQSGPTENDTASVAEVYPEPPSFPSSGGDGDHLTPPMPDLPPPPLPDEFDPDVDVGAGLMSELQSENNAAFLNSDDETDQMTPL